jgi:kynurenine formamidase
MPQPLGGRDDIASIPLTQLYGDGVIVDISDEVGEFNIIKPEHITKKIEVRTGDILIYHTG